MAGRRRKVPAAEPKGSSGGGLDLAGGMGVEHLGDRIARYSAAKQRAVAMRDYLLGYGAAMRERAAAGLALDVYHQNLSDHAYLCAGRLRDCGEYLRFRHYLAVNQVRLQAACFCKQHLICPLCAIRRGSKALQAYLERYQLIVAEHPHLKPYLLTFTVRDSDDLEERIKHLQDCFKRLQGRRREWLAGKTWAKFTEFAKVQGGVGSYEIKRGSGSGAWHPHIHLIALCAVSPDQSALREEWKDITGRLASETDASFIVDVRPLNKHKDPARDFLEVFKYAVKFSSFSLEDNWLAARVLKAARLLFSFGLFRGVKVPEKMTDESLDSLPYVDYFYRYLYSARVYSLSIVDQSHSSNSSLVLTE